ncbi:MAG TPA: LamG domain-containing protein [Streptosporangiaceae bacterium]|nr:LamG domain-containing protein [Streptosporangiaceae bacterium]
MPVNSPRRVLAVLTTGAILALNAIAGTTAAHAATVRNAAGNARTAGPTRASEDQALARARQTGKPVNVTAAETPTTMLIANPDGRFTLTVTAQPVRKLADGTWQPLDATLRKNADGTISPALTATPLVLSGGGTTALATMRSGASSLSLTLPASLPVPVLSGATATYQSVLPGTDLVVTAHTDGGFSDVYVVHDAAAAADPRLAALLTASMATSGLAVSSDPHGDVTARDAKGALVFGAAAPAMWDSATKPGTARSTPLAADAGAHHGTLAVSLSGKTMRLVPDASVLRGQHTVFPVFIDPTWTGGKVSWSTPSQNFPTDPHWNSSAESQGLMQVGDSPTGFWADTLINFSLPLSLLGPEGTSDDIQTATFYITNVAANNCTAQTVDVYAPSATLSQSNDNWNSWFTQNRSLGGAVGTASFAHGWSSSCPASSVSFGLSTGWITSDVKAGKATQTLALAGTSYGAEQFTGNGTNQNDYEVFSPQTTNPVTPALSITFMHAPATPTGLYTSPNASTIGKGDVTLYAPVHDPDGGTLTTTITAYVTGHTGEVIKSAAIPTGSGTTAVLRIPEATLVADVTSSTFGGLPSSTTMKVTWYATVSNGNHSQDATSALQAFTYDISQPGAPGIFLDSALGTACTRTDTTSFTYTVGTPASFYFAPAATDKGTPSGYTYQLNNGEPVSLPASGGKVTATITPTAQTNILTVYAFSPGGNIGQQQSCVIIAAAAAPQADGDVTGDGNADLLVPGAGSTSLPAGLWLAAGTGGGAISPAAANIGLKGTGRNSAQSPADWTGTQVITGQFQGDGFNDVLDYYPSTNGTAACSGQILATYGQALPLDPVTGSQADVSPGVFTYYVYDATTQSDTPVCASSSASGGNMFAAENGASGVATSYETPGNPDLLLVANGSLFLEPDENGDWAGIGGTDPSLQPTETVDLSDKNPADGGSWAGWSIATTLVQDIPAMFAVSPAGAVYYYSPSALAGLAYQVINSATVSGLSSPVQVAASGFGGGTVAEVRAASFGGGKLGVWAVTPSGGVYTYQLSPDGTTLSQLPQAAGSCPKAGPTTCLVTATHQWPLNDQVSGAVSSAADDAAGGLSLQGNSGTSWNDKDGYFNPDVILDGSSGDLATTGKVLDLTGSFTVSAWASPTAAGQVLLSQDGGSSAGLTLGTTGTAWTFGLITSAGTFDTVTGGSIQLGQWTQVTASYDAGTGVMSLWVDGVLVGYRTHTAPAAGATGPFHVGDALAGGKRGSYFAGQVAMVQAWNQALTPITTPSPASYHYSLAPTRIMDTRNGLGGTTGPVAPNSDTKLKIAGTAGIPAAGVTAVAIDLTLTGPTASGNVATYADGDQLPATASLNFDPGTVVTDYQVVPVSPDGKIALHLNSAGTAQFVIDVTGYFDTVLAAGAQTYHPVTATRVLDTRSGIGAPTGRVPEGGTVALQVTSSGASPLVPASATAVAINLTVTDEASGGYLAVYAAGAQPPALDTALSFSATSSSIAADAGDVPLGSGGKIAIVNHGGAIDVIGDILGYYTPASQGGDVYHATNPTRLADTRDGVGGALGPVGAGASYPIPGTSVRQITTAAAPVLMLNVTVTQPSMRGNLVAFPGGTAQPGTSDLNWNAAETIANSVPVAGGAGGDITILNNSTGTIHLVIDCSGFFAST